LELRTVRRIWQIFFLGLFLLLIVLHTSGVAGIGYFRDYPVRLFLELSPLLALASILASGTLAAGMLLALLTVGATLLFGRVFCGWVCPLGTLNQAAAWLWFRGRGGKAAVERNRYRRAYALKYYLLLGVLLAALLGVNLAGLLDPIALTYRSVALAFFPIVAGGYIPSEFLGGWLIGLLFGGVLLLNLVYPRLWCRLLCPLGALLGLTAFAPLFKIRRDRAKCTDCNACGFDCQGGDEPMGRHRVRECHVCLNCVGACPEDALSYALLGELGEGAKLDLDRRRLIITASCAAVLPAVVTASSGREKGYHPGRIRPPGALPEAEFVERCVKCGACMKACPTNALQPAFAEGGMEGFWTPVLVPRVGYCAQNCNLCGRACPTGAIRRFTVEEKVGMPIRLGAAVIDPGRCLPFAYGRTCIVCEEMCPTSPKAIFFEEREVEWRGERRVLKMPRVDLKHCCGCGICETKCPVSSQPAIYVIPSGESREERDRLLL
jgi:MauM/NapG family ferredoxin protein